MLVEQEWQNTGRVGSQVWSPEDTTGPIPKWSAPTGVSLLCGISREKPVGCVRENVRKTHLLGARAGNHSAKKTCTLCG